MLHQLQPPAPEPTSASARRLDRHDWQEQIAPGYKHLPEGSNIVPPMRFNDLPEEDIANFGRTILGAMFDTDAETL